MHSFELKNSDRLQKYGTNYSILPWMNCQIFIAVGQNSVEVTSNKMSHMQYNTKPTTCTFVENKLFPLLSYKQTQMYTELNAQKLVRSTLVYIKKMFADSN